MRIQVKDDKNLVRDTTTNAILNTDSIGLKKYKERREVFRKKSDEMELLKAHINNIETKLNLLLEERANDVINN